MTGSRGPILLMLALWAATVLCQPLEVQLVHLNDNHARWGLPAGNDGRSAAIPLLRRSRARRPPRFLPPCSPSYDPADTNFGTQCEGDKVDACFGGFAKQATVIDEARQAAAARGVDTLVLHAGDQYTGTLWDAVYTKEGIQIAPEFLEMIGVQAFVSPGPPPRWLPPALPHGPPLALAQLCWPLA